LPSSDVIGLEGFGNFEIWARFENGKMLSVGPENGGGDSEVRSDQAGWIRSKKRENQTAKPWRSLSFQTKLTK